MCVLPSEVAGMDAVRKALDKVGGENNSSSATMSSSQATVSSSPVTVSSSPSSSTSSSLIHVQLSPPHCHSSLILTTAPRHVPRSLSSHLFFCLFPSSFFPIFSVSLQYLMPVYYSILLSFYYSFLINRHFEYPSFLFLLI